MSAPDYDACNYPIRAELTEAHAECFRRLARPGTWWTGAERIAIAAEARAARDCTLCEQRKRAISPFALDGQHDGHGVLDSGIVDVVHRIITDPGRLTRSWYEKVISNAVPSCEHYVELVSVSVMINALDVFARAVGVPAAPLPTPTPGDPVRMRPASALLEGAWVPQIPSGAEGGEDWRGLYGDREQVPQIGRALSLVPAEVDMLNAFSGPHYMLLDHVVDPNYVAPGRSLDRPQTELIASRVSAINECFY